MVLQVSGAELGAFLGGKNRNSSEVCGLCYFGEVIECLKSFRNYRALGFIVLWDVRILASHRYLGTFRGATKIDPQEAALRPVAKPRSGKWGFGVHL